MADTEDTSAKRPGRRPQGPFSGKRRTITFRITEASRAMLEAAAAESGWSLAQEAEHRLTQAFVVDEIRKVVREELQRPDVAAPCPMCAVRAGVP